MDAATLSAIFKKVILRDGMLILPFMGAVKLEDVPASFSERGLVVCPPSKKLFFDNYNLSSNDVLLNEYANLKEISHIAAKRALYQDLEELRNTVEENGSCRIEGFGTFSFDAEQGYYVETDPDFLISTETFGLSVLDLREATTEQETVEQETAAESKEQEIAEQVTVAESKEQAIAEQETAAEKSVAVTKKKNRIGRVLLYVVLVAAILLILAMLVYIFKEELRPWLEEILYSKEELEIIRYKYKI